MCQDVKTQHRGELSLYVIGFNGGLCDIVLMFPEVELHDDVCETVCKGTYPTSDGVAKDLCVDKKRRRR